MSAAKPSQKQALPKIRLENPAAENWSRLSHGPSQLPLMRAQLFKAIQKHGSFSLSRPRWMTQDKPGIDAWLHLPGEISLELTRADESSEFAYYAKNALAPKSIRRRAQQLSSPSREISPALLQQALTASSVELQEMVHFSFHCCQQLKERTGIEPELAQLQQALADNGWLQSPAPVWANSSSKTQAALCLTLFGEELALPVVENAYYHSSTQEYGAGKPLVATTTIPRRWSENGLWGLQGHQLAEAIYITSAAALSSAENPDNAELELCRANLQQAIAQEGHLVGQHGQFPTLLLSDGCLILRTANAEQRQQTNKFWLAVSYQPTIPCGIRKTAS